MRCADLVESALLVKQRNTRAKSLSAFPDLPLIAVSDVFRLEQP
jgi:hypothetical protein